MSGLSRRGLLASLGFAAIGHTAVVNAFQSRTKKTGSTKQEIASRKLALEDYIPKSMLHVHETPVPRAMFPVIDFHTHLSWSGRRGRVAEAHNNATPEEVLPVMDGKNVRMMVNLTGGYGKV